MKIVIDESVGYGLVEALRRDEYEVISIAEGKTSGNSDEEVFKIACDNKALLITRDYHFTNPVKFSSESTGGIIYIRHGNLRSDEEISLIRNFLYKHQHEEYKGRLVTLYPDCIKIR